LGCDHYLTKDQLGTCLDDIVKTQLADQTGQVIRDFFKEFVTDHQPLKEEIQSLASRYLRKPVILYGETGVGKGEVARLIHRLSGRNAGQFVDINVSTLSEALVESELFGHNEGAFTGASKSVRGKIHLAHEGTLFLDEIGMLTLTMQQKLLKVLEEKVYYRVGSDELQHSNFQLISATCDDIVKKMVDGGFRHDLYHRINGLPLTIPPLRHRREDIPLLIEHFIKREPRKIHLTAEAMDAMQRYNWYGNVRELQSLISQLVFAKKGTVTINDLPDHVVKNIHVGVSGKHRKFLPEEHYAYLEKHGFHRYIAALETEIFQYVMERFHGKVGKIAKYLKITGSSYYHLKRRRSENL
jgi:transcriptional regulator with PAS, ATPase and Fis domain